MPREKGTSTVSAKGTKRFSIKNIPTIMIIPPRNSKKKPVFAKVEISS